MPYLRRHRSRGEFATGLLVFLLFFGLYAGWTALYGRVCGGKLFSWDPVLDRITVGAFDFYPWDDEVKDIVFDEDGGWTLRYWQGQVQGLDAECSKFEQIKGIEAFTFKATEGDLGTVMQWDEKPNPDRCDANGDGIVPAYNQVAPNWYVEAEPKVRVCTRRAYPFDSVLAFIARLLWV